jgi:hypothetical protein
VAAFHAWTCDKSRSLADRLIALGHLDSARRAAVEALAALHVEAHDGDVEKSLAAVPANRLTRASLAALGEPEIEATLARVTRNNHGQATVVDWGLAKAIGRADPSAGEQTFAPSSSGSSETLPGSALGTVERWMADLAVTAYPEP